MHEHESEHARGYTLPRTCIVQQTALAARRNDVQRSVVSRMTRARRDTVLLKKATRHRVLHFHTYVYMDVHIYIFVTRDSSGPIVTYTSRIRHFAKLTTRMTDVSRCTRDTKFNNGSDGGDDSDVASHTPWRSHGLFCLALVQAERHLTGRFGYYR